MHYRTFVDAGDPRPQRPKHRPGLRCGEKRRFKTNREAVLFARSMYNGDNPCGYRIYRCPFCGHLHLTSEMACGRNKVTPEFDRLEKKAPWKYVTDQEWFCEWVAQRLANSDDPTVESILICERLEIVAPYLTPAFLLQLSLPRFSAPGFNCLSPPMEFQMATSDE